MLLVGSSTRSGCVQKAPFLFWNFIERFLRKVCIYLRKYRTSRTVSPSTVTINITTFISTLYAAELERNQANEVPYKTAYQRLVPLSNSICMQEFLWCFLTCRYPKKYIINSLNLSKNARFLRIVQVPTLIIISTRSDGHLRDSGVDGRIILRWIFRKWDGGGYGPDRAGSG